MVKLPILRGEMAEVGRLNERGWMRNGKHTAIFCGKRRYISVQKLLRNIIILAAWLTGLSAKAQYDAAFSHYFDMEPSFNPAAVGKENKLNVNLAYAIDFAGFEHNPRTMYAAADLPFYVMRRYQGGGVQFVNEKIGLFKHQRLAVQYACRFKLAGGNLRLGFQAGLLNEGFDGSKVDLETPGDPAFSTTDVNGNGLDLSAGLYYMHGNWYAGASLQHLNGPTIRMGDVNELGISATYYLTGGYNIKLRNPFLKIKPSVLLRTDGTAYRADITGRLVYTHEGKMLYGGIGYSPTNSVTALFGGTFHGVVLAYSYEVYTSGLSLGNGSHELFVGYQMDINLVKRGKNKHQSVRIL